MNIINLLAISIKPCEDITILRTILFIKELLKIVTFAVPIVLIVLISVDLVKNVIASKDDEMKKNFQTGIKRLIYAVALFLVPTIVSLVIEGIGNFDTEYKDCLLVTEESIQSQIVENKAKCIGDDYKWDENTYQCLIKPTPPDTSK